MRKPLLAPCLLICVASRLIAGDDTSPPAPVPIATDRPAVTDSSVVVPQGSLQFENGLTYTSSTGQQVLDAPETLLRLGVAPTTELRFTAPDYYGQIGSASGFGDLSLGVKQQLIATKTGFDASLVLTVSLPTGGQDYSSHGYDPSIQLPWSKSLSTNWTAAGMFSVYWPTQGTHRNVTGQATFLFDRQLTKACDAFIEYVGGFPEYGSPSHLLHIGTAYKLTPRQQIDLHAGIGLSAAAPSYYIGAGYSFRLPAFR